MTWRGTAGPPLRPAFAAEGGAILDIHSIPALLDAMALAGFTLEMAAAALRAAIAADDRRTTEDQTHGLEGQVQRQSDQADPAGETSADPPGPAIAHAVVCNNSPTIRAGMPAWKKRREELKKRGLPVNWRGRLDAEPAIAPVAPAIAPLSPIDPIGPEEADVAPAIAPAPAGAHPLPQDWQPSAGRRTAAIRKLGETGAANLIAKFCNHFHARGSEVRTAAGWQGRFTNWLVSEHGAGPTLPLPLMRNATARDGPAPDDKWEALRCKVWEARPLRRESG